MELIKALEIVIDMAVRDQHARFAAERCRMSRPEPDDIARERVQALATLDELRVDLVELAQLERTSPNQH